jgi:hypothetical protein
MIRRRSSPAGPRWPGAHIQFLALALTGTACVLSLVARRLLPERFLLDDHHIRLLITSPMSDWEPSQSFRNIAALYRFLGLGYDPAVDALLTLVVFTVAVFTAARWSEIRKFGFIGGFVLTICFLCAVVYLAQYSKESLPLLLVPLLMTLPKRLASELAIILIAGAYAALFRPYWFCVAAFYTVWRIVLPRTRNPVWLLITIIILYALLEFSFRQFLGSGLTDYRAAVNESRAGQDVASLITDPFSSIAGSMVPSAMCALLGLLVPVQLFVTGNPIHLVSGAMLACLWIVTFRSILTARRPTIHWPQLDSGISTSSRWLRTTRGAALLLAVVSVQAIFEPDFGSYLKHLTPLLPLFLTQVPLRQTEVRT